MRETGPIVAKEGVHLQGDTLERTRFGNHLSQIDALTEKGEALQGTGDKPNWHDILAGSPPDGRANTADHNYSH